MATTYTRQQVRGEILLRHPWIGFRATADSVGTTYIASVSQFQHSNYGAGEFKDLYFYRYGLTGNDRVKQATTLDLPSNPSRLQHGSANYSDTTDTAFEGLEVHPDILNGCIITAQRKVKQKVLIALTRSALDFDMETSGVAFWDGNSGGSSATSNTTPTKSTSDLFSGTQSLKLTASGASGRVRGAQLNVFATKQIYTACIARADVGTVSLKLYDTTGAANFGTAVDYTGEQWALLERIDTIPTGCEIIQPEYGQVGASDIAIVDTLFGPYEMGEMLYTPPTWMDESYEIKALRPAQYRNPISTGVYSAYSRDFQADWVERIDFEMENLRRDVTHSRIQIYGDRHPHGLPQCPVWISAERELFATEPLASESATTSGDLDEIIAYAMIELIENQIAPAKRTPEMEKVLAQYKQKAAEESIVRPNLPVKQRTTRNRVHA